MKTEYYVLLNDQATAEQFIDDVLNVGITERDLHVISNDDDPIKGLHKATIFEKTHFLRSLMIISGLGALAGLFTGLLIVLFPVGELTISRPDILFYTSAIGFGIGIILSLFTINAFPKTYYDKYKTKVLLGAIIVIINVPTEMIDSLEISDILYRKYASYPTGIVEAI